MYVLSGRSVHSHFAWKWLDYVGFNQLKRRSADLEVGNIDRKLDNKVVVIDFVWTKNGLCKLWIIKVHVRVPLTFWSQL